MINSLLLILGNTSSILTLIFLSIVFHSSSDIHSELEEPTVLESTSGTSCESYVIDDDHLLASVDTDLAIIDPNIGSILPRSTGSYGSSLPDSSAQNVGGEKSFDQPLRFEKNIGQFTEEVHYRVNDVQATHFFLDGEIRTSIKGGEKAEGYVYAMEFVNPVKEAQFRPIGGGRGQKGKKSYHTEKGSFPDVPLFRRLYYDNLWDGVSTVFYEQEGQMKYDFNVAPGIDPEVIQMVMKGAEDLQINSNGELMFSTPLGRLTKGAPYTYQIIDNKKIVIDAEYQLSNDTISFVIGEYDKTIPLIIDPIALKWSAYLEGGDWSPYDSYFDPVSKNLYITGSIDPDDGYLGSLPSIGSVNTTGSANAMVVRMDGDGSSVLWSVILGGSGSDEGHGIYVDENGDIFLKGTTNSTDFPVNGTVASFDATHNGSTDQFVMRLSPDASTIKYSSYFGGAKNNYGNYLDHGIVVIGDNIYGSGSIRVEEFPELPTPTYLSPVVPPNQNDVMAGVYSINTSVAGAAGLEGFALIGSDFYGADDIQKDAAGNIYISGFTYGYDDAMLTPDAVQKSADILAAAPDFGAGGGGLPIVAKFNSSLTQLLYASYVMPVFADYDGTYGQARQMLAVSDDGDIFMMTDQYFAGPNGTSQIL